MMVVIFKTVLFVNIHPPGNHSTLSIFLNKGKSNAKPKFDSLHNFYLNQPEKNLYEIFKLDGVL